MMNAEWNAEHAASPFTLPPHSGFWILNSAFCILHSFRILPAFRIFPYTPPMPLFQLVQIVFWIALSTWFGGVLFIAVAAPVIFRTVREYDPLLPSVLSVNLEGQHGTLLAGSIVGNVLDVLHKVQMGCAAGVGLALIGQWLLTNPWPVHLVRTALFMGATGLVIYDWRVVRPRLSKARQEYLDNADNPEVANPARELFDRYHRESVLVMQIMLALLLGIILFSAGITPAPSFNFVTTH